MSRERKPAGAISKEIKPDALGQARFVLQSVAGFVEEDADRVGGGVGEVGDDELDRTLIVHPHLLLQGGFGYLYVYSGGGEGLEGGDELGFGLAV
ncbi:MAG: hypothetical protein ACI8QI_001046 [Limisphaerales bacterium]